jgi:hypothetical protein
VRRVGVALALLLLGGCAAPPPTAAPSPAETSSPAPAETPLPNGMTRVAARSAPALPGVSQPLTLYTHCGLENAVIDFAGSLWDPAGPPVPGAGGGAGGGGGPNLAPEAVFADPMDEGSITLTGFDRAVFVGASGARLDLVPHRGPKDVMVCY